MTGARTAPYGEWTSPISAAELASGGHPISGARFVGDEVWWSELRSTEGGRYLVRRRAADGAVRDVLPAPWNARSRVHEYGGEAWTVTAEQALIFCNFADQRLYRLDPGSTTPLALTPQPEVPAGDRYAEPTVIAERGELWCVRESYDAGGSVLRDLVAIPLDGSGASDPARLRSVLGGSHFLASPRLSPDRRRVAWIAWNHPQMPWDGTELRVAELRPDGVAGPARTLLGSPTESVLQPEWIDDEHLYVISDRSGWWNLYRIATDGDAEPEPLCPLAADFAGPLWQLGARYYQPLPDGRLLTVRIHGTDTLGLLDPATGQLTDLDLGDLSTVSLAGVRDGVALVGAGGGQTPGGLRTVDLSTGAVEVIALNVDDLPAAGYLPEPRVMTFTGERGRDVHAIVYPPRNPDFVAAEGELPPYIAFVHGGPTGRVTPRLDPLIAYFTSRGLGVADVNYGGSTGYGREYRERLRGQWGIVDVQDVVSVLRGLVEEGLADGDRLAIEGGSAGGWTVLSALTQTDVFACGASYFGVAELVQFAEDTHDFESRYTDGLIGPLPEALELYETRAPLNNVDRLSCPVLLLQGLDDEIVPPSQAEMFRDALLAKQLPHAYLAFAGESHGFRQAATIVAAREAELSFYGQIMGFEPPGIPRLELWRP